MVAEWGGIGGTHRKCGYLQRTKILEKSQVILYLRKVWKAGFGVKSQGNLMTLKFLWAITGTCKKADDRKSTSELDTVVQQDETWRRVNEY